MTCLIPFDLSRLDGNLKSDGGEDKEPVMDQILNMAKVGFMYAQKESSVFLGFALSLCNLIIVSL